MISTSRDKRCDLIFDNYSAPPLPAVPALFAVALKFCKVSDRKSDDQQPSWLQQPNCYIVHLVQLNKYSETAS